MMSLMTSCGIWRENRAQVINSFCDAYQRVIVDPGDGKIVAARKVKERLAANETLYQCKCVNAELQICEKLQ